MQKTETQKFRSEIKTFSYLFCALVSLCTLPILSYHYYTTLDGFALLAIGGLLMADCVLWFSSHWSTRPGHPVMRAVSLAVKFAIAAVMVSIAGIAMLVMRSDRQTSDQTRLSIESQTAEIQARAEAVRSLAGTAGTNAALRELAKTDKRESVGEIAAKNRTSIESRIPAWLLDQGLYSLPPLSAIVGALILSICALTLSSHTTQAEPHLIVEEQDEEEQMSGFGERALSRTWPSARRPN